MPVKTERISVETQGAGSATDLTREVAGAVEASGIRDGVVIVFVPGSTAGVTTIEFETGLLRDMKEAFDRLAPEDARYAHDRGGEDNGRSHVMASIVGPSCAVPVVGGRPSLGTWQQVVLLDFDTRPRKRDVIVQVVGDV